MEGAERGFVEVEAQLHDMTDPSILPVDLAILADLADHLPAAPAEVRSAVSILAGHA